MKTILITGISRGIGKALALKFLKENYFVIGTSITGQIDFSNENLKVFKLDLSIDQSIRDCIDNIKKINKKIDILINNAGVLIDDDETHVIVDKIRKTLEINLIGTINFTESIISEINKGGHILNISSQAGSLSDTNINTNSHFPNHYPAYKISKCALNMYTRTLSMVLNNENREIKVSSIHPGWTKTDMGGEEAPMLPEDSANYIFNTATDISIESGQFWFRGERIDW